MNENTRILIAYATRTGSTVGVAEAIGKTLAGRGYPVDVAPIKENPSLDGYGAVVLGSAINGAQWLPEAASFVKTNQTRLNRLPLALFCVHIMNLGDDERPRRKRLAYLDPVRRLVRPASEAYFAGLGMDPADENPIARWAFKLFNGGEAPVGDNRDWSKIRGWAEQVFA